MDASDILVGMRHYPLDCLILARGFQASGTYPRRAGFKLYGPDGLTLSEKWGQGMHTLHGLQSHQFLNCFFLVGANAGSACRTDLVQREIAVVALQVDRCAMAEQHQRGGFGE